MKSLVHKGRSSFWLFLFTQNIISVQKCLVESSHSLSIFFKGINKYIQPIASFIKWNPYKTLSSWLLLSSLGYQNICKYFHHGAYCFVIIYHFSSQDTVSYLRMFLFPRVLCRAGNVWVLNDVCVCFLIVGIYII